MGLFTKIAGIVGNLFQFGNGNGPVLKNNSGVLEARNSDDSAYAVMRAGAAVGNDDVVTKSYGDANYSAGSGDVTGPASAADNAVARFDGTTGKSIQNSSVIIDDSGNLQIPAVGQYRFNTGPLLKNASGVIEARTNGDAAYAVVRGASPVGNPDLVTLEYLNLFAFGGQQQTAASEGVSSTTSATFQQKVRLTTTNLPTGTYFIGWYVEYTNNDNNRESAVRIELDDTTELGSVLSSFPSVTSGNYLHFSGLYAVVLTGIHTVDLDFRRVDGGTASVRRARILLWRIGS